MFAEWGGMDWGVVGLAEGSLGGLCCEHCEDVDGYGVDGVGSGVSVVRMRKSVASVGLVPSLVFSVISSGLLCGYIVLIESND